MRSVATFLALFFLLASAAFADYYRVTTTADSGPGSLRDGILAANTRTRCEAPCYIVFNLPAPVPDAGWYTIKPQSPLPIISGWRAVIDGHSQTLFTGDTNPLGPEIEIDGEDAGPGPGLKIHFNSDSAIIGLAINRFHGNGVVIEGGFNNTIGPNVLSPLGEQPSNYIGVDPTGTRALPNEGNGVALVRTSSARVEHNLIAGNRGNGIFSVELSSATISENIIGIEDGGNGVNGIDVNGSKPFGSLINIINNRIAYSAQSAIATQPGATLVNALGNAMYRNAWMSIDVGHDGVSTNSIQPPLLTLASTVGGFSVHGVWNGKPNANVHIEFFASREKTTFGLAAADRFLGSIDIRTDSRGEARFDVDRRNGIAEAAPGEFVSASATTTSAGTSELSDPLTVQ